MLKFSGFSDLTSCLCLNAFAAVEAAPFAQTDHNTIASGAQSNVIAWSWIHYTRHGHKGAVARKNSQRPKPGVNENE